MPPMFTEKRIDTANVEFEVKLPPTTIEKKYDLYVTVLRKNRRSVPSVIPQAEIMGRSYNQFRSG